MAFQSAAYAVVARIFKLVDSTGFTRLFFGPIVDVPIKSGYGLQYEDPGWTQPSLGSSIFFGDSLTANRAMSLLESEDATQDVVVSTVVDFGVSGEASTTARDTGGATAQADIAAGVQRGADLVSASMQTFVSPGPTANSIELRHTISTNARRIDVDTDQLFIVGQTNIDSTLPPTASVAGVNVGNIRAVASASGAQVGVVALVAAATNLFTVNVAAIRAGIAVITCVWDFNAIVAGVNQAVGELTVNGVLQAATGTFVSTANFGRATVTQTYVVALVAGANQWISRGRAGGALAMQSQPGSTTLSALVFQ